MNIKEMKKGTKVALLAAILVPSVILGYVFYPKGSPLVANPLVANFDGIIGYAKIGSATPNVSGPNAAQSATGSELIKGLLPNGTLKEIFSADVPVYHAAISPLGELYIHTSYIVESSSNASKGAYLDDKITQLLKINLTTSEITPLVSFLQNETIFVIHASFEINKATLLQFDAIGNIYFVANPLNQDSSIFAKCTPSGEVTILMEGPIRIWEYVVTPSSGIFVYGGSLDLSSQWLRYISTEGSVKNLAVNKMIARMAWFPDGNIYFIEDGNMYRLYVNGTLDSKKWIGTSSDSYHVRESDQSLHRDAGTFYIHSNDNTFLVSGNILFQVYPTFKEINSTITQYQTGIVVGSKFYLSGTNKDLNNCFLTYDIESEDEQILLSAENIDIYQMDWSASQKTLFFSGLNFNGNKQVIGKFYPINSSVSLSNTGSSSKVNIGVFG